MEQEKVLARLKSIEGHVRGVERMVEDGAYCIDIIHQTLAIKRAIDKVNQIILSQHLEGCVTTAIRSDEPTERERVINELLDVFELSSKL
ncbi:MAG: metal-sensitive transcriptional regulator [Ardenticatenaceae bacterium]|nr:metal-sensitive transcriptional regulator [Ardenticatenaceae bacterium]HBY97460.1 transcriptional regulator [Chloroflexota bacterium]